MTRSMIVPGIFIVLVAVFAILVVCNRIDDSDDDATPTPIAIALPTTESSGSRPVTSTPVSTGGAAATETSTPTATSTPIPPNAVAKAGPDQDVERGGLITLNGSGSEDPDNEPISYTWTQIYGPDVTGGVGVVKGPTPLLTAPDSVGTVILELRVNDGHGDSPPDTIRLNVMEHTDTGFFVDGDNGGGAGGGGSGGIGGQGGGGQGGASYGVLVGSNTGLTLRENVITAGTGGNGGIGGAAGLGGSPGGSGGSTGGSGGCCSFLLETAGTPGTGGQGGLSYAVFDFDTNDNFTPTLSGNTIVVGQAGEGSAINGKPGESGETNFEE